MSEAVYTKLAKVLDTLPNGFPGTEDGLELKILKRIFEPDEAELFCDLRIVFETPEQIAERTGRPLEGLEEKLVTMGQKGQVFAVDFGEVKVFKMLPWAFGIYEFQLHRMDREMAEMFEEYGNTWGPQFLENKPSLMQVIPIEREISGRHESLSYEQVSTIIESGQSFGVNPCICRKEKHLLGKGCDKPLEVCLAIAPIPGVFENAKYVKALTREEAYEVLRKSEEAGLVHLTWNMQNDHFFICNCCGCCCGILRGINEHGIMSSVNSYYYAQIDADECVACGTCADERCPVQAIEETDDGYRVLRERCIGCGLCASTCPTEAIRLVRKPEEEIEKPPENEMAWFKERGRLRGVDFSQFE